MDQKTNDADGRRPTVGVLTGGGDAPGLNAAICGLGRRLAAAGMRILGFRDGWRGVIEDDTCVVDPAHLLELVTRGGTILGSSSASPYRNPARDVPRVLETIARHRLHALVTIGGDGTLQSSERLHREHGVRVVAIPKTIDNDLSSTDFTFGFFTAVERATAVMDQIRTTADSHGRVMVVECMGRHAGWITAYSGLAAGAEAILVPERKVELTALYAKLRGLRAKGRRSAIVAVAEGARIHEDGALLSTTDCDEFGHFLTGGVADLVAKKVQRAVPWEARAVVLGHMQRSGSPIAFDRIFALRLGARAARLVLEGHFGRMAALSQGEVVDVPLSDAVAKPKLLTEHFIDQYEDFFVPFESP